MKQGRDLVDRANEGDKEALATLRERYKENPGLARPIGNMAKQARRAMLEHLCGDDQPVAKEAITRTMIELRKEVEGPNPSPMERLLAERVALCWLQVHHVETLIAQKCKEGLSMERVLQHQKWQDRAHRRYLTAIKAVAQVRKLLRPNLQVNIADKQINVA